MKPNININYNDLLNRSPKKFDKKDIKKFIRNKTILITGAGGSIGSELSRKCSLLGAKKLILLDHSEINLYTIGEELQDFNPILVLLSILNKESLDEIFKKYLPDIVIHAAAYKHVRLLEDNIEQGILNNIIGTKNTIDSSIKWNVKKFILISTDKAIYPTSIMGATKRVCELYAQNVISNKTEIVSVRFGNVLGSSGSVIPKFISQIEENKDLTVTNPETTRYFMFVSEACDLVLQVGVIAKDKEIMILDIGEPVKILDLAKRIIELSDKKDTKIKFCGLYQGEKLHEELLIETSKTLYDSILLSNKTEYDNININILNKKIEDLLIVENKIEKLKEIVPNFNYIKI